MQYRPQTALGEQVRELGFDSATRVYTVRTDKQAHPARAVLIAAGVGSFQPKTLPLANAAQYEGCGLYYFVKEVGSLAGRRVLIVGGGDSAVDWANTLAPIAADVTLIHRRDQFRAHEDSVAKMRNGSTVINVNHELKAIAGDGRIESALIYDNRSKHEETL